MFFCRTMVPKAFSLRATRITRDVSPLQRRQPLLQIMRHQRFKNRVDIAFQEYRQVVEREFDAMVGHAVLRKVVGADAFVAFAGADLRLALGGILGVLLGDPLVELGL